MVTCTVLGSFTPEVLLAILLPYRRLLLKLPIGGGKAPLFSINGGQGRPIEILLGGLAPGFSNYWGGGKVKLPQNFRLLGGGKNLEDNL